MTINFSVSYKNTRMPINFSVSARFLYLHTFLHFQPCTIVHTENGKFCEIFEKKDSAKFFIPTSRSSSLGWPSGGFRPRRVTVASPTTPVAAVAAVRIFCVINYFQFVDCHLNCNSIDHSFSLTSGRQKTLLVLIDIWQWSIQNFTINNN
jgi:hypothetical protein